LPQSKPLRSITREERESYERDGVCCVRDIFPREWLSFLADAIEEAMASPGPHGEEYTRAGGRRSGEVAIPTKDPGLPDGAILDCDRFPVVWTAR
jgi:hypothetical protein